MTKFVPAALRFLKWCPIPLFKRIPLHIVCKLAEWQYLLTGRC